MLLGVEAAMQLGSYFYKLAFGAFLEFWLWCLIKFTQRDGSW
ncbi:hypothetical protein ALQ34_200074 [Pseudomonas syringae pv. maculicola]|nr:hypothetical protein ALQ34_200074 [Pseudomonas syringae pv. maculicola]